MMASEIGSSPVIDPYRQRATPRDGRGRCQHVSRLFFYGHNNTNALIFPIGGVWVKMKE